MIVEIPATPNESRHITDDVSRHQWVYIHSCFNKLISLFYNFIFRFHILASNVVLIFDLTAFIGQISLEIALQINY